MFHTVVFHPTNLKTGNTGSGSVTHTLNAGRGAESGFPLPLT
jgi:hypothetical protein